MILFLILWMLTRPKIYKFYKTFLSDYRAMQEIKALKNIERPELPPISELGSITLPDLTSLTIMAPTYPTIEDAKVSINDDREEKERLIQNPVEIAKIQSCFDQDYRFRLTNEMLLVISQEADIQVSRIFLEYMMQYDLWRRITKMQEDGIVLEDYILGNENRTRGKLGDGTATEEVDWFKRNDSTVDIDICARLIFTALTLADHYDIPCPRDHRLTEEIYKFDSVYSLPIDNSKTWSYLWLWTESVSCQVSENPAFLLPENLITVLDNHYRGMYWNLYPYTNPWIYYYDSVHVAHIEPSESKPSYFFGSSHPSDDFSMYDNAEDYAEDHVEEYMEDNDYEGAYEDAMDDWEYSQY